MEIIKREYVKKLDPVLAEKGCLSGLHQYNEVGTLEQLTDEKETTEVERLRSLSYALQGRNQYVSMDSLEPLLPLFTLYLA